MFDGTPPPAWRSQGHDARVTAQAAPTHPGAPPEQLGGSPWPQEPASGRPKAEDSPLATAKVHAAADRNEPEVIRLLLAHGAPHSTPGKGGFTPLALAARAGIDAVLPPLLEAGANPDALMPLTNGKSARELAVVNKRTAVLEVFDAHAAANGSVVVD